MTATARRRRTSFRTRLTLAFTAIFLTAGIALLVVVYGIVGHLFDASASEITVSVGTTGTGTDTDGWDGGVSADRGGIAVYGDVDEVRLVENTIDQAQAALRTNVLGGLLAWSIGILAVFAALAAAVAWWMARASLHRIAGITEATRAITQDRLGERLDLPGPRDEIKELGDTIDAMLERLEASFARQQRFIANASHELRTPIATARTALEAPLDQGRVPSALTPAVARAIRATERSETIIDALLTLARADTAPTGSPQSVELDALVTDTLDTLHDAIVDQGLTVTTELANCTVAGEPALLERLVGNLLDNAVRHNTPGGTIQIAARPDGNLLELSITNTGPTITPEAAAALTEPFNRGPSTRLSPNATPSGHGLGLSIVASIIHRYGGTLHLAPRDGGGLTATVRIPQSESSS